MKSFITIFIAFWLSLFSQLYAQQTFSLTIYLPKEINTQNIQLRYDNGKEFFDVKPDISNDPINISDSLFSNYAHIAISFDYGKNLTPFFKSFFFDGKKSKIHFIVNTINDSPSLDYELVNCIDADSLGGKDMKLFTSEEDIAFEEFYSANVSKLGGNDSLMKIAKLKMARLQDKQIEFVKKNGKLYYSLWFFRNNIIKYQISRDSILSIFQSSFTTLQKSSPEGKRLLNTIGNVNLGAGDQLPFFSKRNISGTLFSSNSFMGKYLIIDFWASWCTPCIAELPQINDIRKRYSKDILEIIFITQDTDTTKFNDAVKKYGIGWGNHFFANNNLIQIFGALGIPKVFLVDPQGKILYNNAEEKDYNDNLIILNKVLSRSVR